MNTSGKFNRTLVNRVAKSDNQNVSNMLRIVVVVVVV